MKNVFFLFFIVIFCILTVFCCVTDNGAIKDEQMIKGNSCKKIFNILENRELQFAEYYCIVEFKKLKNLYKNEKLSYIGSNSEYHFFNWYVKVKYYEDQPSGFAVLKREFTPKNQFDVKENKIGEAPFN